MNWYKETPKPVDGFMDMVDYDEHLPNDMKGTKVYPTLKDLKRERPCTKQCGIVKVQVSFVQVIQEQDYSEAIAKAMARRKGQSEDQPQGSS